MSGPSPASAAGLGRAALVLASLALAACAPPRLVTRPPPRAHREPSPTPAPGPTPNPFADATPDGPLSIPLGGLGTPEEPGRAGVLHVVRRGETVYRIARAYGVSPADLLEANGIADARRVGAGAELFVPGVPSPLEGDEVAPGPASAGPPAPGARPQEVGGDRASGRPARLTWPVEGILYGRFGVRSGQRHDGIDLAGPEGTPIAAADDGTVIFAGRQSGYGSLLILRHPGGLVTVYAHCSELLAEEGRQVRRGEVIARVGQTGRTTGPHLHFEVRQGTRPRNPLLYLP